MPRKFRFSIPAVVVLLVTMTASASEDELVADTFNSYKAAVMNDRGEEAAGLLSKSTTDYYAEMRDLALHASRSELMELSTVNLMQALMFRHLIAPDRLKQMSGREIIAHAVDHGWTGKDSVAPLVLKSVHVVEDTAVADIVSERGSGVAKFRFNKEDGSWKVDLMPVIAATSVLFDRIAASQGVTREDLIFSTLSAISGRQVADSIWSPPLPAQE